MAAPVSVESLSLKEKSVRGAALTLSSQGLALLIQVASAAVLGRLLTPADFGLVAMVTAITALAGIFVDLGLSAAVIQQRVVSAQQSSNLFWLNLVLGFAVTAVVAAAAPAIGWFYGRPELTPIALALSTSFLISSLSAQQMARLTRDLRFGVIAAVRVSALLAGFVAGVWAAYTGLRHWALVLAALTTAAWTSVFVWLASGWLPGWPRRGAGTRQMIRFGSWVAGFNLVNYFSRNLDNVLIGRVWGATELGFYSRAYSLLMLPVSNLRGPLAKVAFPAMSRLQHEPARYRNYFLKYCSSLAFLSMPAVGLLFVSSEELITLVLGPQWREAGRLFAILAAGALIQPVCGVRGVLLMSQGAGRRFFVWGLANAVVTVVAFAAGLPWGASGVALAYTISTYLVLHPSLVYATRGTPVSAKDFYVAVTKPFAATAGAALVALLVQPHLPPLAGIIHIGVNTGLFLALFLAAFAVLPAGRAELKAQFALLRPLFGLKGRTQPALG